MPLKEPPPERRADSLMSKAFTKETDSDADDDYDVEAAESLPANFKNYVTPFSLAQMKEELHQLHRVERPKVVEVVSWAAGNGDRSENGDYIYGKKRLREIDRRVRYLLKRIESAELVDPEKQQELEQVFFGATVTYESQGKEHTVKLVGLDEADLKQGKISWISPLAKVLMKARVGDVVELNAPGGKEPIEILALKYE